MNKGTRGYDPEKLYTNDGLLTRAAAEAWTVENAGMDPKDTPIGDLYEGETAQFLDSEFNSWLKVARPAVAELVKRGGPLTLAALEPISHEPKFSKLFK